MKSLLLILLLPAAPKAQALWRNAPTPRLHSIFDDGDTLRKRHQWFTPERSWKFSSWPDDPPREPRTPHIARVIPDNILHRRGVRMEWWGGASTAISLPILYAGMLADEYTPFTTTPSGGSRNISYDGGRYYYYVGAFLFAVGIYLLVRGNRLAIKHRKGKAAKE